MGSEVVQRVPQLILATAHSSDEIREVSADEDLLLDIDLAILGSPAERFRIYEDDVRAEYAWVPEDLYREKRAALLRRFVDRPRLYRSAPGFAQFESRARSNLAKAILRLGR